MIPKIKLIKNYPPSYPLYKKILLNLIHFLGSLEIRRIKDSLNETDRQETLRQIRPGDVLLLGNLRSLYSLILGEQISHAGIYIGGDEFVHSRMVGVKKDSIENIVKEYDTLILLRLSSQTPNRDAIIESAIKFADSQVGKPYDLELADDQESYYCTKLIIHSFKAGSYAITSKPYKARRPILGKIIETRRGRFVSPISLAHSNLDIIFKSHNLT